MFKIIIIVILVILVILFKDVIWSLIEMLLTILGIILGIIWGLVSIIWEFIKTNIGWILLVLGAIVVIFIAFCIVSHIQMKRREKREQRLASSIYEKIKENYVMESNEISKLYGGSPDMPGALNRLSLGKIEIINLHGRKWYKDISGKQKTLSMKDEELINYFREVGAAEQSEILSVFGKEYFYTLDRLIIFKMIDEIKTKNGKSLYKNVSGQGKTLEDKDGELLNYFLSVGAAEHSEILNAFGKLAYYSLENLVAQKLIAKINMGNGKTLYKNISGKGVTIKTKTISLN